jgi:serine phosphatase RsbU (regulator of sigma subunit)/Tfp pilus assembly protein PilF
MRIYLIFFLFIPGVLFSQSVKIDSLTKKLDKTREDFEKAKMLNKLALEYNDINIDKAIELANYALEILENCDQDSLTFIVFANVYNSLGIAYNNKADFKNAVKNFEKAIEYDKKSNNLRKATEKLLNLGIIYKSLGNYKDALLLYDSSLRIAIKLGYDNLYTMTKINMGVLNYELGDFDNALKDYYEALEVKREEKDLKNVAILLYNIGLIFDEKNDIESANSHYLEALELFRKQTNLYGEAYCLGCIGSNYVKEQNYLEAIDYYNQAYAIHEKLDNKQGMGESFGEIGTVYYYNKKYAKASEFYNLAFNIYKEIEYVRGEITILQKLGEIKFDLGKYNDALALFEESFRKADSISDKPQLKDAYDYLAHTYAKQKNYEQAFKYYKKFSVLKDTIFNSEVNENITKLKAQHDISVRENEINILKNEKIVRDLKMKKQKIFNFSLLTGLISIFVFIVILFFQIRKIRKAKDLLAFQKKQITDSIEYASRIQTAVLPPGEYISKLIPEHFIFYKPRDIVSGDFYWITHKEGKTIIAAVDCTGHGVPGAFMSMLGFAFLNEIVNKSTEIKANAILNQLRDYVKESLHQTGKDDETKDGMDLALCIIDTDNLTMQYSGAYNPLYLIRNENLISLKADRMPIGIHYIEKESFTNHEIDIVKGDTIYVFTDGYVDQFGGPNARKFKLLPFKEMLLKIKDLPMEEQKRRLEEQFYLWKGDSEQIDDVLVMGIRI